MNLPFYLVLLLHTAAGKQFYCALSRKLFLSFSCLFCVLYHRWSNPFSLIFFSVLIFLGVLILIQAKQCRFCNSYLILRSQCCKYFSRYYKCGGELQLEKIAIVKKCGGYKSELVAKIKYLLWVRILCILSFRFLSDKQIYDENNMKMGLMKYTRCQNAM